MERCILFNNEHVEGQVAKRFRNSTNTRHTQSALFTAIMMYNVENLAEQPDCSEYCNISIAIYAKTQVNNSFLKMFLGLLQEHERTRAK